MNIGQMAAQLNQANFGQAQTAAESDIANQLKAAQGNQTADLQQSQLQNTAAAGLETLGNDANRNILQNYSMASDAGQQQQQQLGRSSMNRPCEIRPIGRSVVETAQLERCGVPWESQRLMAQARTRAKGAGKL